MKKGLIIFSLIFSLILTTTIQTDKANISTETNKSIENIKKPRYILPPHHI